MQTKLVFTPQTVIHQLYVCYHFVEGVDYDVMNYAFSFPRGVTEQELNLDPNDDDIVEADETYSLAIVFESSHERVILGEISNTTIIIYDDEGK